MQDSVVGLPISARDYYDTVPSAEQYPGDIWSDIPTFGVLPQAHVTGLVVTPACDLANRKAETITVLPVLPIRKYVCSVSILPELKRSIEGQLQAGGLGALLSFPTGFLRPAEADTNVLREIVASRLAETKLPDKERAALCRVISGLDVVRGICSGASELALFDKAKHAVGERSFRDLLEKIVRNSYRLDVHFLPSDEQRSAWSGVAEHAVALFRYPITIPTEVFDLAQVTQESTWTNTVRQLSSMYPCVVNFTRRPLKRLRLKARFLSDLLTRFTAVFSRLGSPDFTEGTIDRYVNDIGGGA